MKLSTPCSLVLLLGPLLGPAPAAAQAEIVRPAEGASVNRIHLRFRWGRFDQIRSDYTLAIVEDDGSADPFATGTVTSLAVPRREPRVVVKSGLEFGKSYAWRASALVGQPPMPFQTPVRRFQVAPLPPELPPMTLEVPPGAGPVEPGLVIFTNAAGPSAPPGEVTVVYAVAPDGRIVWFLKTAFGTRAGDLRQIVDGHRDGRMLLIQNSPELLGPQGRGLELTLDGGVLWRSPDVTLPSGYDPYSVHHEIFPMPNGDFLCMVQDDRVVVIHGNPRDYAGDALVQFDRHTRDVVWSWSTFDGYSVRDVAASQGPTDWTHGNAVVYDPATDRIVTSIRSLSRITVIDRATRQIVYNMGEQDFPAGDVPFGDDLFSFQHAPQLLPNGNMLLYDNGNEREPLTDPRFSRAIELAFDDPLHPTDAQIVWQYVPLDAQGVPIYTAFVGDADRLPGGHTLVTVGRDGKVDEVDAAGNLLWRLQIDGGFPANIVYRAEKIAQLVLDHPGDADDDGDLDLLDLAYLQVAQTGPGPAALRFPDTLVDHDRDGDLDADDASLFAYWASGPGR